MTVGHASRARDGGDVVVAALATVLGRTRDRLAAEGLTDAAELVADLAEAAHDYLGSRRERDALDRTAEGRRGTGRVSR
jgi:hypothetical protein